MGQRFTITESEKNEIRGLYEQPVSGVTQDVTKIFSPQELESLKYTYIDIDKFNGNIQVWGNNFIVFSLESLIKNGGTPIVTISWPSNRKPTFNMPIMFDDGTKATISFINGVVNKSIIPTLRTKIIKYYRIGDKPSDVHEMEDGEDLKNSLNAYFKINSKNATSIKTYIDELK